MLLWYVWFVWAVFHSTRPPNGIRRGNSRIKSPPRWRHPQCHRTAGDLQGTGCTGGNLHLFHIWTNSAVPFREKWLQGEEAGNILNILVFNMNGPYAKYLQHKTFQTSVVLSWWESGKYSWIIRYFLTTAWLQYPSFCSALFLTS